MIVAGMIMVAKIVNSMVMDTVRIDGRPSTVCARCRASGHHALVATKRDQAWVRSWLTCVPL